MLKASFTIAISSFTFFFLYYSKLFQWSKKGSPSLDFFFFFGVCVFFLFVCFRGGGMGWAKGVLEKEEKRKVKLQL